MNFPNYGKERIAWGQDFPVIVDRIKATIDTQTGVNRRVLVAHDWGCVYGYMVDEVFNNLFRNIHVFSSR